MPDAPYVRSVLIDWSRLPGDAYPRRIPALAGLERLDFESGVTLLAGENGSGKSTLLEAMATAFGFNAEGGSRNYHFSTYDDVSPLAGAVRLIRGARLARSGFFFRAESFFNVATATLLEYNDGSMPDYHAQSHGESFLEYLQSANPRGFYLMDEPEAALSPQRQLSLMLHIRRMAAAGGQFIIATHSPILLGLPGARILRFDGEGIRPCAYEDTESYQVTKLFIENREGLLRQLFREEQPPEP